MQVSGIRRFGAARMQSRIIEMMLAGERTIDIARAVSAQRSNAWAAFLRSPRRVIRGRQCICFRCQRERQPVARDRDRHQR